MSCKNYDYIYAPSDDSYMITGYILNHKSLFSNKSVLDVGTGSGILALAASKFAGKVLAVDINKNVVSKLKGETFQVKCSDLFSNVESKFDIIMFNAPYLPEQDKESDDISLAVSGGKHGYEIIERFLSNLNSHLKEGGFALLLFSSLTNKNKVDSFISKFGFSYSLEMEKRFDFETLFLYKIVKQDFLKDKEIKFLSFLSEGKRGLVYDVKFKGRPAVVKVKKRGVINDVVSDEAFWLSKANSLSIGPKILLVKKSYLIMDFVQGVSFKEFLKSYSAKDVLSVLIKLLKQMFILDYAGIVKEEMTHPQKHIIIRSNSPILIDFERAHFSSKPKNVTQFIQFLTSKRITELLSIKFYFSPSSLRKFASDYKSSLVVGGGDKINHKEVDEKFSSIGNSFKSFFKIKPFSEQVYSLTALIPKGKVLTYEKVAEYLGSKAYRAVGTALHKNPYKEVPCHRVVNSDGYVGGFAHGQTSKIKLLMSEGVRTVNKKIDLNKFLFKL